MSDCQKNSCPLECDTIKYDIALSTLQNPSLKEYYMLNDKEVLNFSQLLGRNLSFDQFEYMWVNLRVFYPSLEYTEITESPQTNIFDLFTQIGGSLGLFVSFSVFTLFEIGEIFLLIFVALLSSVKYPWLKARSLKKYSIDNSQNLNSK